MYDFKNISFYSFFQVLVGFQTSCEEQKNSKHVQNKLSVKLWQRLRGKTGKDLAAWKNEIVKIKMTWGIKGKEVKGEKLTDPKSRKNRIVDLFQESEKNEF